MKTSLTTRLTRTLFFLIAATVAVSMVTVELFVNDVEDTILGLELKADADYFKQQLQSGQFQQWKSGRLEVMFLPDQGSESDLPTYFQNRALPFSSEIETEETILLIYGEQTTQPPGRLFLAQDITIMENREVLVQLVLLGVAGVMLLLGFFISRAGAIYLVRPFKKLTRDVLGTEPGQAMQRLSNNYRDQEFEDITEAFNRFLSALESHVEREKSFVKLASHELRTPLAVIVGALNVLEKRQGLSVADQKTLGRIRSATQTMRDDTEVLLELARSETSTEGNRQISVRQVIKDTINDLEHGNSRYACRVTLFNEDMDMTLQANPALVRLLLRNLLQNALRHTRARVEVHIFQDTVIVRDFGEGLPFFVTEQLASDEMFRTGYPRSGGLKNSSFGLLIVQLVCERLGWVLEIGHSSPEGTELLIHVQNKSVSW